MKRGDYWEGVGTPQAATAWTSKLTDVNEYPAVAIRVVFTANPLAPQALPYIDEVAFTYRLK